MIFKRLRLREHNKSSGKFLRNFIKITLAISTSVFVIAIPMILDHEAKNPLYAKSYSATPFSCIYEPSAGTQIKFKFRPNSKASSAVPAYSIDEAPEEGKTLIVFNNVDDISGEFTYNDVVNNPLVEKIDYHIKNDKLIVQIDRRNNYLPAAIIAEGQILNIILSSGNSNYPIISNQKPANNSAAFPAIHPISFDAMLASPLQNAYIFLNGNPVQFSVDQAATSTYSFYFKKELKIDTDYKIKAIITDKDNRTSVAMWEFVGQIPSATILGKDRFRYLGWWGQIAASGVAVRKAASTGSEKVGTLSSAERVKVLEEAFGEWVDGKNLWYRIDGGKYAGNYVFSDYIIPMEQPIPPRDFIIPEQVKTGERWIDVNLAKRVMTLFEYDKPLFATYISPGRTENPTQTGIYRIWYKLKETDMQGGPPLHSYSYYLTDIPWTMFYNYDYAIHGTYWHDKFGTPQSAGCTNMTQGDAKYIFENTLPEISEGKEEVFARDEYGFGTGTIVYNHE